MKEETYFNQDDGTNTKEKIEIITHIYMLSCVCEYYLSRYFTAHTSHFLCPTHKLHRDNGKIFLRHACVSKTRRLILLVLSDKAMLD